VASCLSGIRVLSPLRCHPAEVRQVLYPLRLLGWVCAVRCQNLGQLFASTVTVFFFPFFHPAKGVDAITWSSCVFPVVFRVLHLSAGVDVLQPPFLSIGSSDDYFSRQHRPLAPLRRLLQFSRLCERRPFGSFLTNAVPGIGCMFGSLFFHVAIRLFFSPRPGRPRVLDTVYSYWVSPFLLSPPLSSSRISYTWGFFRSLTSLGFSLLRPLAESLLSCGKDPAFSGRAKSSIFFGGTPPTTVPICRLLPRPGSVRTVFFPFKQVRPHPG